MNKVEQLHLNAIEKNNWGETEYQGLHTFENSKSFTEINAEIVASKSAEITEQIAIEFYEWAETSKEAFNKASKEYKKQYGIYPSNKEYKIV
jgi:hypothetical protein